ncbi:MAG: Ig-like domain-containing protein [Woeseiaceae bacterium]
MRNLKLVLPAVFLILTACGGGGSAADTTAPTVSSTTPATSAIAIARNSTITATFDEDIFASTVNATNFTLDKSGAVSGAVTFDGTTNIATFTPSSDLVLLANYTATLSTAITDLSGNALATNYNWSFTTADGTWGTAELIETDAGTAVRPQIAFDSSGKAMAVWYQYDGTRFNIWANRFNGTTWGAAELIETDNAGSASTPQIAFDSSGNAMAVWRQSDGTRNNIWANRFK